MIMDTRTNAFLFSVQRALPDELSPALSGVAVDSDEKTLYIRCFFQGPVSDADREFLSYLRDAVWADYFPTIHVEVEALDADLAEALPVDAWAYRAPALV